MRSRPTMRDVAALAAVSFKTVSRVVNGEPGVSDELVARVQQAAEQLDYRHNLAASNLRRGRRTMSVGVLVQDVGDSFDSTMLRAIEDRARARGIAVFTASLDGQEDRERESVADLVNRQVDGLVIMASSDGQGYLRNDIRAGLAVVVVDRPARHVEVDSVLVDNVAAARAATQHLLAHGHRRIGFVSDLARGPSARDRRVGYQQALELSGLAVPPQLVRQDARAGAEMTAVVCEMLRADDPPTAVFAAASTAAVGAIRALRDLGRHHEVALVAFDDFPMADLVDPGTTVVSRDARAIGHAAADLLLKRLDGSVAPTREVLVPTTLVQRGSGEIVPPAGARPSSRGRGAAARSAVDAERAGRSPISAVSAGSSRS